jgi:hypothetical protein
MKTNHHIYRTFIVIFIFSTVAAYAKKDKDYRYSILDNIDIDIDGTTLVLTNKYDNDDYVEITSSYELYINGREIELSRAQRRLVADYYNQFYDIMDSAREIGKEGARIGMLGAKLGLKAAKGALKAIFTEYEMEELEEELEWKSEELEELAEELEEKAEEIEEMAEKLEDLHYELSEEIDALNRLRWF